MQRCTLLSIKTGGCPETCNYCSQSSSWSKETGMKAEKLMDLDDVYQVRSVAGEMLGWHCGIGGVVKCRKWCVYTPGGALHGEIN